MIRKKYPNLLLAQSLEKIRQAMEQGIIVVERDRLGMSSTPMITAFNDFMNFNLYITEYNYEYYLSSLPGDIFTIWSGKAFIDNGFLLYWAKSSEQQSNNFLISTDELEKVKNFLSFSEQSEILYCLFDTNSSVAGMQDLANFDVFLQDLERYNRSAGEIFIFDQRAQSFGLDNPILIAEIPLEVKT